MPMQHMIWRLQGHQTRKQAVSIAVMADIDLQFICQGATWALSSTFAKYYSLDLMAKAKSDFGKRVLMLAGSSSRIAGTGILAPCRGITSPRRVDTHIDLSTS